MVFALAFQMGAGYQPPKCNPMRDGTCHAPHHLQCGTSHSHICPLHDHNHRKRKRTERSKCASKGGDEKVEACNSLADVHLRHDILFCLHCVQWATADMLMPAYMSYLYREYNQNDTQGARQKTNLLFLFLLLLHRHSHSYKRRGLPCYFSMTFFFHRGTELHTLALQARSGHWQ